MIFSTTNLPTNYYVYAYLRSDGSPYYIGKGIGNRAWYHGVGEIKSLKNKSNIAIIEHNLTEIGSLAIERRMIRWYGRKDLGTGILRNKTDGGEGTSGYRHTEEERKKMKERNSGQNNPFYNKTHTIEAKLKNAIAHTDKKASMETRSKMSATRLGHITSVETKTKIGNANRGRILGPQSEENRAKKSKTLKETLARKKLAAQLSNNL